jgi:chromosomal replication initiator protein
MSERSLSEIWSQLMTKMQRNLPEERFERWFSLIKPLKFTQNTLILETPNPFSSNWLQEHYGNLLENNLKEMGLGEIKINFVSATPTKETEPPHPPVKTKTDAGEKPRLNSRYTFDAFVIGPSNRIAHAVALAVAESPAKAYNPLFIYGGVGLGKTHLLQAIGHYIYGRDPQSKVTYISSEEFTNQLINAIQNRTTTKFREKYRNVDTLLIDDIYFIAGKESTQEEFFHTFNTLFDSHKQIVLSSDRSPKEIQGLEERLVSRFGWGMITDIQPPDFETRNAILIDKAKRAGLDVPQEVIRFLSEKIKTNIRELEGALIRIIAHATLTGEDLTLEFAQKVLKDLLHEEEKKITVELIQKKVAEYFNIRFSDMHTRRRNQAVAFPRQIAMYLVRELTNHSLPEIGVYFGGKDHTTILHAYHKIQKDMAKNRQLKDLVQKLLNNIIV